MLIKGRNDSVKNLRNYVKSFDPEVWVAVLQFLEVFDCCKELQNRLWLMKKELQDARHRASQALMKPSFKHRVKEDGNTIIPEPGELTTVVGICPRCGGPLVGLPLPGCESRKTDRTFYKECKNCIYYAEIFNTRKGIIEVEGG